MSAMLAELCSRKNDSRKFWFCERTPGRDIQNNPAPSVCCIGHGSDTCNVHAVPRCAAGHPWTGASRALCAAPTGAEAAATGSSPTDCTALFARVRWVPPSDKTHLPAHTHTCARTPTHTHARTHTQQTHPAHPPHPTHTPHRLQPPLGWRPSSTPSPPAPTSCCSFGAAAHWTSRRVTSLQLKSS